MYIIEQSPILNGKKMMITSLILLCVASSAGSMLVPPDLTFQDIPEGLSDSQFQLLRDDSFEFVPQIKKPKLSDYTGEKSGGTKERVQHSGDIFIVYPESKSGDFDVFYKGEDGTGREGEVHHSSGSNSTNVQRDTFAVENDFENEEEKLEEFNKLKDDNGEVENDTFHLENDLE